MSSSGKHLDEPAAHGDTQHLVTVSSDLKWASGSCTQSLSYLQISHSQYWNHLEFLSAVLFLVFFIWTGGNRENCIQHRLHWAGVRLAQNAIKLSGSITEQIKLALSSPHPVTK